MKPSPTMQQIVQLLAERHGINLSQEGAHVRLTMEGYQPLVIESIGLSRVVVAHYFTHNGDLVPDPIVTLFTADPIGWIPMGITHSFGGSQTYAVVSEDGTQLTCALLVTGRRIWPSSRRCGRRTSSTNAGLSADSEHNPHCSRWVKSWRRLAHWKRCKQPGKTPGSICSAMRAATGAICHRKTCRPTSRPCKTAAGSSAPTR